MPVSRCRGFLQQRQQQALCGASLGEAWLFFGCRGPEEDFLYRRDWEAFLADGTLSQLEVAYSRQQVTTLTLTVNP
jgi:sulfite reductase alpha subunit-like flavoprotein